MKRELAALESSNSPVVRDSIARTTRASSSSRFRSNDSSEVSKSLVYKRVKRFQKNKVSSDVNGGEVAKTAEVMNGFCDDRGGGEVEINGGAIVVVEQQPVALAVAMVEEVRGGENGGAMEVGFGEGNGGGLEVDEGKMVKKTRSNGKKRGIVEGYTRRFTRSALKVKEVENGGSVEGSGENSKFKGVVNGEVCKEIVLYEPQKVESNVEVKKKAMPETYVRRRFTRSALEKNRVVESVVEPELEPEPKPIVVLGSEAKAVVVAGSSDESVECGVDEPKSATARKKLEMKMSKQISHVNIPTNVQELFETGLLEGCPVYYDLGKGMKLHGRIKGIGILCSCSLCKGSKVIPPSLFEIHACNKYKRAVQYIRLENGRSLLNILKTCKSTRLNTLEATVQNAVGPLPEKKTIVCQNCKEQFSSMDAESSEPVCSTCVMSHLSPVGPVYSTRKRCRSSKFDIPSQAVSARNMSQDIGRRKSVEKSADALVTPRLCSSSRVERPSETKTSEKSAKRSFKAALSPKLSKSTRPRKASSESDSAKAAKRLSPMPNPLKIPSAIKSSEKTTSGKITKKDIRLHKLVFEDDVLPDGTELSYYARGQKLLDGFKKGYGIFCNCCETVVSASQFEAHAGCAKRRKPYCYIYTSNGVSLHELSVTLIKDRQHSAKYNDDLCSICLDGGNLLLCDGCPRAFHTECASLSGIPRGKWYCNYCENMFEREKFVAHNANAFAAGRVSGVDSIEQITKRSIRIVNNLASEVSACILCRGHDFCKSGFGPRTIILCDQCEKEYHVGCLKDHNMAVLTELPDGKWFCSKDCGRIESSLENLLVRGVENLPVSLVDVIQKKNLLNVSDSGTNLNVSWRLLSGKIASPETRPLLSQAVAIFHESFAPIIDVVSGNDLIPAMVYGRNVGGQEYGGMYCAVLIVNSEVVSAGIFRIFGPEVAELPLVATRTGSHGKGYFQTLFTCIERLLACLKVKTLVLPAAEEAGSIWTHRFGFERMTPEQIVELKRNFWSLVRFQGTSMLHKVVPECRVNENLTE